MSEGAQRGVEEGQLCLLGITPRQAEVLYWISKGKSNHDIGVILGASTRTVCKHVEHILSKLHVENRTAAAAIAFAVLNQM
jgi:DNA-binding NarL/FixJ family response regulator